MPQFVTLFANRIQFGPRSDIGDLDTYVDRKQTKTCIAGDRYQEVWVNRYHEYSDVIDEKSSNHAIMEMLMTSWFEKYHQGEISVMGSDVICVWNMSYK